VRGPWTRPEGWRGVRSTIAVRSDQSASIATMRCRPAFDWDDDHVYSVRLGGEFWARDGTESTHPFTLENDYIIRPRRHRSRTGATPSRGAWLHDVWRDHLEVWEICAVAPRVPRKQGHPFHGGVRADIEVGQR